MTAFDLDLNNGQATLKLAGRLDMDAAESLDKELDALPEQLAGKKSVIFDFSKVDRLEPNCAFLLLESAKKLREQKVDVKFADLTPDQETLLKSLGGKDLPPPSPPPEKTFSLVGGARKVGETAIDIWHDALEIISFFGDVAISFAHIFRSPEKIRVLSTVTQIDRAGLNAVPIICLMSFLIGGIIAQQGAFQLRKFGADLYVVNMVGILVLRELGVLLAAIMFAGRSGSAYTAEIGSMKMREEIDAMRVIGLDPVEVLAVPRLVALVIALPLVTILSNLSALAGGMLVCWAYVGIPPDVFITYIETTKDITSHMFIGLVKAPFMAIIIGVIACVEGLRVGGSTESLGRQTTTSVVKSIFMVIVIDGIFATIFTALDL
ncbi:MAG: MlaE family lipid ABC transporter permease subunit [Pseudomonadota bacterium]